ncbi:MAG: hypothetical protein QM765_13700 [Myxococcales bacterium]
MKTTTRNFKPNPRLRAWLRSSSGEDADAGHEARADLSGGWDGWLLRRMSAGKIVMVGGVLVDRDLLTQRFGCVAERCAPRAGRGPWRSCCADAEVALDGSEQRRLRRIAKADLPEGWCEDGHLTRPGGRCVCSTIDGDGRIRCRLHRIARRLGVDQSDLQPLSCRLFPLIVVDLGQGRTALTLVSRTTFRLVGAHPPRRYPCLSDPHLPLLTESLRGDLDWAFGKGFAQALARSAHG